MRGEISKRRTGDGARPSERRDATRRGGARAKRDDADRIEGVRRGDVMATGSATVDAAKRLERDRRARAKRKELRSALEETRVNQEELQKPENDDLERAVDAADAMNEGVERAREMVLDMELYGNLAGCALERTKRLGPRGSAEVSVKAFLQSLCRKFVDKGESDPMRAVRENPGAFHWHKLGTASAKFFMEAPVTGFMNGVMDTEVKERRMTQRRVKDVLAPSVAPDAVEDTTAEKQTDKMMQSMNKKLRKQDGGSTRVTTGVKNADSFPQFVENVFTAAFLVKDGRAGIAPASNGGVPTLSHMMPPPASAGNDRSSFVLHMDMANWRALNALTSGEEQLMATREDVDDDVLYGNRGVKRDGERAPQDDSKRVRKASGLQEATNTRNPTARTSLSVSV